MRQLLDTDGNGALDLHDCLVGLALMGDKDRLDACEAEEGAGHANFILFAYALLDPTDSGSVARGDLERILRMVWPHLTAERARSLTEEPTRGTQSIARADFERWARQPSALGALREAFAGLSPLAPPPPPPARSKED